VVTENNIHDKGQEFRLEFGRVVHRHRLEKGLSQEKLAALADLHRAYVGQIERGEKNIGLKNLEKIAKALGVNIKDLL